MTQFSKDNTSQPHKDAQRSLLSRITEIFSKKRDVESALGAGQTFADEVTLPSIGHEGKSSDPVLAQFFSPDGEPTFLSVRRVTELPEGIQDQVEFRADHNYGSERHTLSYALVTHDTGQMVLHGTVRALGISPLVTGPCAPDECHCLLSFEIKSHGSGGNPLILARSASKLTEVFADHGVHGADEYLQEIARSVGNSCAYVERSARFEMLSGELANQEETVEGQKDTSGSVTRLLSQEQLEKLNRVQDALHRLDDLSQQVFGSEGEGPAFTKPTGFSLEGEEDELIERRVFENVSVNFSVPSLRLWADFTPPNRKPAESVLLSLRLPPVWLQPSSDMSCLKIQVLGPKNRLGLRERYTIRDVENVLEITDFSVNDEAFRNLFITLHRVNTAEDKKDREVDPLLDVLEHYGLRAQPASVLAYMRSCKRFLAATFAGESKAAV
jgi:hypothetical protein